MTQQHDHFSLFLHSLESHAVLVGILMVIIGWLTALLWKRGVVARFADKTYVHTVVRDCHKTVVEGQQECKKEIIAFDRASHRQIQQAQEALLRVQNQQARDINQMYQLLVQLVAGQKIHVHHRHEDEYDMDGPMGPPVSDDRREDL